MRGAPPAAPARGAGARGPRPPRPLRSALYEGTVVHARRGPRPHRFTAGLALPLLFLDELADASAVHPLADFSPGARARRPAALRLRRDDYLPDLPGPLDDAARHAARAAGAQAAGPVAMLGHVRTWGWLFNPVTLYYCYDGDGDGDGEPGAVSAAVLEVTNTPWHERAAYAVGPPGRHRVDKALHVSPFLPMDLTYRVTYSAPGERLHLAIDVEDAWGTTVLATSMALRRRALDRSAVTRLLWHHPAMPLRVSAGIYRQAAALAAKRVGFHPHPGALSRRRPRGAG